MNRSADLNALNLFAKDYQEQTDSGYFAAFFEIRSQHIQRIMLRTYDELYALGKAQAALLQTSASAWASDQAWDLLEAAVYGTDSWIKTICDVQQETTDTDELFSWGQWRAPKLLAMKPYGQIPFKRGLVWQRKDQETTHKWLERFRRNCRLQLEGGTPELPWRNAPAGAETGTRLFQANRSAGQCSGGLSSRE